MTRIRNVPKVSVPRIPRGAEAHHALAHLGGEQMKEDILLDGQCAVQRAGARAAAEDGSPHPAPAHFVDNLAGLHGHAHILRYCSGGNVGGAIDHQVAVVADPGLEPWQRLGRGAFNLLAGALEFAAVAGAGDDAQVLVPRGQAAQVGAYRVEREVALIGANQVDSGVDVHGDRVQRRSFQACPR